MNKRGFVQDWLFFGLIMVIIFFVVIVALKIMSGLNDKIQLLPDDNVNKSTLKSTMQTATTRAPMLFDGLFIMIFVLLIIAIFVSMFLIDSHPALLFVVLIAFAVIILVMAMFGNVFDRVLNDSPLESTAQQMPMTSFISNNWLIIITVVGMISIILLFSKMFL